MLIIQYSFKMRDFMLEIVTFSMISVVTEVLDILIYC